MKKIAKIVVERPLCIGAGTCVVVADKVFKMDEENIAVVLEGHGASDEDILAAAQSCPTAAILLYDEDGKLIYPPEKK